jgi:hypothetical protein
VVIVGISLVCIFPWQVAWDDDNAIEKVLKDAGLA